MVPLLVSSRGYGILWDNYSFTKIGDIGDTVKIAPENLYDINGKAGGLTQEGNKWIGELKTESAGVYIFKVKNNRCAKVKISEYTVIDQEVPEWIREIAEGSIVLDSNNRYKIEIEGFNPEQLIWQIPGPKKYSYTSLWSELGDQIDYYFIYGPELDSVVSGYRRLTGRAVMLPRSAFGFWQSRERYKTSQELLDVVKEFRRRKVPLDYIVQDYHFVIVKENFGTGIDTIEQPDKIVHYNGNEIKLKLE